VRRRVRVRCVRGAVDRGRRRRHVSARSVRGTRLLGRGGLSGRRELHRRRVPRERVRELRRTVRDRARHGGTVLCDVAWRKCGVHRRGKRSGELRWLQCSVHGGARVCARAVRVMRG
jgi:hypothetical protein